MKTIRRNAKRFNQVLDSAINVRWSYASMGVHDEEFHGDDEVARDELRRQAIRVKSAELIDTDDGRFLLVVHSNHSYTFGIAA